MRQNSGLTLVEVTVVLGLVFLVVMSLTSWQANEQALHKAADRKMTSQATIRRTWGLVKGDIEQSDRCLVTFGQLASDSQTLILNLPRHDESGFPSPYGKVVIYQIAGGQLTRITPQKTEMLVSTLSPGSQFLYFDHGGNALGPSDLGKARQIEVGLSFQGQKAEARRLRLAGGE